MHEQDKNTNGRPRPADFPDGDDFLSAYDSWAAGAGLPYETRVSAHGEWVHEALARAKASSRPRPEDVRDRLDYIDMYCEWAGDDSHEAVRFAGDEWYLVHTYVKLNLPGGGTFTGPAWLGKEVYAAAEEAEHEYRKQQGKDRAPYVPPAPPVEPDDLEGWPGDVAPECLGAEYDSLMWMNIDLYIGTLLEVLLLKSVDDITEWIDCQFAAVGLDMAKRIAASELEEARQSTEVGRLVRIEDAQRFILEANRLDEALRRRFRELDGMTWADLGFVPLDEED